MGSAVSSGVNNDDLVNNLVKEKYITSRVVEQVFRAVDRGHFVNGTHANEVSGDEADVRSSRRRNVSAYEDLAWREGNLHLSAPCIYTHVMEELDLKPGLSFLNLGSGTGYLSLMVGHIIGPNGCNHGVEIHQDCIDYANERINSFIHTSAEFDKFNIGLPEFFRGNCLCIASDCFYRYDRVYCGAAVPSEHIQFIKLLVKPGGILVLPCGDQLVKITVKDDYTYDLRDLLPVSFASLVVPSVAEMRNDSVTLPLKSVPTLKELARTAIREVLRNAVFPLDATKVHAKSLTRAERAQKRRMNRSNRLLVGRRRRRIPETSVVINPLNESSGERTSGTNDQPNHALTETVLSDDVADGLVNNIENAITEHFSRDSSSDQVAASSSNVESPSDHNVTNAVETPSGKVDSQNGQKESRTAGGAEEKVDQVAGEGNEVDPESSNDSLRQGFSSIDVNLNTSQKGAEEVESGAVSSQPSYSVSTVATGSVERSEGIDRSSDAKEAKRMRITESIAENSSESIASQGERNSSEEMPKMSSGLLNDQESHLPLNGSASLSESQSSTVVGDDRRGPGENNEHDREDDDDDGDESSSSAAVTLPFPIRFFLDMQNHVRSLDLDEMINNPRGSFHTLDELERDMAEEDVDEEDSSDDLGGLAGDVVSHGVEEDPGVNEQGARRSHTLSLLKVGGSAAKRSSSAAGVVEESEARPHPSVFWVRDRITQLDVPEFLLDYLLYYRKYCFD